MKLNAIVAPLLTFYLLAQALAGQKNPSLADIITHHRSELARTAGDAEAYQKAVAAYLKVLRGHLATAQGAAKGRTRFALVSLLMVTGERQSAKETLGAFDVTIASGIGCAIAAEMAQDLRMTAAKATWVAAALSKKSSFAERMELGMILMTALAEVDKAEALFADAMANAKGAEKKAEVQWHIARATREREDLPEGAYTRALDTLAQDFPATKYGKIAADRRRAMDFKIGGDPIALRIATRSGGSFDLARQKGKVALLCFFAAEMKSTASAVKAIQAMHHEHAAHGLAVVGIWLDESTTLVAAAIERGELTFPQAIAKGGWDSPTALRFRVENAPQCLLIGRDGKIAGMNFLLRTERGQRNLAAAVAKALGQAGGDSRR